jgi:hypothetical protein
VLLEGAVRSSDFHGDLSVSSPLAHRHDVFNLDDERSLIFTKALNHGRQMDWDMKIRIRGAELAPGAVTRFVQLELEFDLHAIGTAERIRLCAMCVEHG